MSRLRLTDRALVRVTGEDWRGFLQGLLTQDVETITPGVLRYGALLTPQGRLLVDLFLLGTEDGLLLDVAADRREDLIRRLAMYRLRSKVVIAADEAGVFAAFGDAPGAGWIVDPRLPALGWRGYGLAIDDTVGRQAWDAHRIALAVPDMADFGEDATYPIEANLDLLNAIDFKKGCFVGQETTSRMKRRGVVKSRMLPLRFAGQAPAPGAEVLNGELRAGVAASGVEGLALGLMRLDRIDGALTVEGRSVEVLKPDWL
ncbi:tRNA-modifying protein YgfZ [Caulobacter sp. NIBR1757]|nr:tRNA-modifying protein YgfZ [Caulobacter sp. NIBR1757]